MGGRGRGGRGGGRGGPIKSLNREQLNALGATGNDMPVLVTQPPQLYPLFDRRPVQLSKSKEYDYLLILKQDFIDHMQLSASYLKMPINKLNQPEQELDKLVAQLPTAKEKYNWSLFPSELRPKVLAKRIKVEKKKVNIQERLNQLEQIEGTRPVTVKKEVEDEEQQEEAMDEDIDEEMDEGTDYANNYFDNGEDYEDEDDNLDDGPIY